MSKIGSNKLVTNEGLCLLMDLVTLESRQTIKKLRNSGYSFKARECV